VAIANPDMARVAWVNFNVTDSDGNDFGEGVVKIPPGGQFVSFLDQVTISGSHTLPRIRHL
jgi:hypothetical protein